MKPTRFSICNSCVHCWDLKSKYPDPLHLYCVKYGGSVNIYIDSHGRGVSDCSWYLKNTLLPMIRRLTNGKR